MFHLIEERIPRQQVKSYEKNKEIKMDINYAHDLFNYMSEQVLWPTSNELKIRLTGRL